VAAIHTITHPGCHDRKRPAGVDGRGRAEDDEAAAQGRPSAGRHDDATRSGLLPFDRKNDERAHAPQAPMSSSRRGSRKDMTERDPALAALDALIGTWATEATHPEFDAVVPGSTTFEWLEGGRYLIQRSRNDHEAFPDSISVIGAPEAGDGLVMEYFDSRGVRRTYGVAVEDGGLRIWRDDPTFAQRYAAAPAPDAFEGQWQLARTPGDWRDDLRVTYRRRPG